MDRVLPAAIPTAADAEDEGEGATPLSPLLMSPPLKASRRRSSAPASATKEGSAASDTTAIAATTTAGVLAAGLLDRCLMLVADWVAW